MGESIIRIGDARAAKDAGSHHDQLQKSALAASEHTADVGPERRGPARAGEADPGADRDLVFRRRLATRRERRLAVVALAIAAALLVLLIALAEPLDLAHRPPAAVAVPIAVLAVGLAAALLAADALRRAVPDVILAGALGLTALVGWLVARSGGAHSAHAAMHVAPAMIAAAFLDRRRFALALLAALGTGFAPALYDTDASAFLRLAAALAPAAVLGAVVTNLAATAQRADRDLLLERTAEAVRQAEIDPLTGLGNYRAFWRRLESEISRARRHKGLFSLVLLDLDDFRSWNDELGHRRGDEALRGVADTLRVELRDEDVCCRQGGDEFAVMAVAAGDLEARELAARLCAAISALPFAGDRRLTATTGWATYGRPAGSADEMIFLADEALRSAKRRRPLAPKLSLPSAGRDQRPGRLDAVAALARELAGARDDRPIAETLATHAAVVLGATGAQCVRWDGEHDAPITVARVGTASGHPAELELASETIHRRRARVLVAAGAGGREHSELAAPVLAGGEPWGYLLALAPHGGSFDADDRRLAESMCAEASRALGLAPVFAALRDGELGDLYRLAADLEAVPGEAWRVADLAWQVGRRLGLDGEPLRELYLAGLFHDIGAAGLPAETLHKADPLDDAERALLRTIPLVGERLLRDIATLASAAAIVRHGHERFDGRGYPDGLAGERIPLASRVLLACDAWVAMTSPRSWRAAFDEGRAREELTQAAGTMLDPRVVQALLEALEEPLERGDP
jgi:diguanylate cyclase (GGDEF)-like protein